MSGPKIEFSVFTKPWKMPLGPLGEFVAGLGFEAVELPIRPGYQVEPDDVTQGLPKAAQELAKCGIRIASIAGPTTEDTVTACAEAGIPIIRTCLEMRDKERYLAFEARCKEELDALLPLLERFGITLGIQNHYGREICNAMGIRHLIEDYDPKHIAAVWDAAHCALSGECPEMAIDIVWSYLCMVNLKNAFWRRRTGPEAENALWEPYWTTGRHGLASWPVVAAELKGRNYSGPVCLTAEYSDQLSVNRLIAQDIVYAKSLFP